MTRGLGRVLVGGKDCGAGFVLGPRLAVTAHHVVRGRRDNPVMYVPADGESVAVERVQPDLDHDVAILWLAADAGESLPASAAVQGAKWRVESPPPGGNDPHLHGTVTTARMIIHNAEGQPVEVVQLEVNEQLGGFGGYSGSAVLDSPGRAVLAVLVEQKPLRIPVLALGEKQAASNVLYAVPIKDVIIACGLLVRAARPLRFDAGLLAPGMVTRVGLLDQAVSRVIGTAGGDAGAGLVLLQGAGGLGKTVLARQVAEDVRVWAEFTDGIVMLRAGQSATADLLASQLQETLGGWDMHLADVPDRQRLLLIVDDVWDQELVITLRASLPPTVTVLATTRGVSVPGAAAVPVRAVGQEEAIQILARDTARSSDLDRVLADLAKTLFHWPLLLTLAASEIHRDDELGWGLDDAQDARQGGTEPDALIRRAQILRGEFPDDLTMLDELERTGAAPPPRSVKVLVQRSLDWMGPEHRPRFELLGIYPPGAAITQPMLEDLWETTPNAARKEIRLLVRAGLAQPLRTERPTIELHDLITAWLHYEHGLPGEASHRPTHQRLAALCHRPDGSPRTLTRDRAEWLAYHLLAAGAWDMLKALPTLSWRSTFLVATGSDATFLAALDQYGHAARVLAPGAVYHAVRAWLFAAQVRALIGALPVRMVVAMALVGDPIAGITQAGQHPEAGRAVPAVLAAVANQIDTHLLIERALTVTEGIPDAGERSIALAGIAEWLAGATPADPALIERALAVAEAIPDAGERSIALAGIAEWLAGATPADPALIKRALAVAETVIGDGEGSRALARIVGWLAGAAPGDPALIKRALAVAEALHDGRTRSEALAGIAERLAAIDPARAAALFDQALAAAQAISGDRERSQTLAGIAARLAGAALSDPALIKRALAAAQAILHDRERSQTLASIATWLAAIDPGRAAALIDQTLAAAQAISEDGERSLTLAGIAERLAGAALSDPALIKRALAVAEAIPYDGVRSQALAGIAERLAPIDPARAAALIDQTLVAAQSIPHDWERSQALAGIAERLAAIDPGRAAALIDQALAAAETISDDLDCSRTLTVIAEHLATST